MDSEARAQARVGAVLKDKWRLDALVGVGGMAVVYSATHRNQKRVAIKMLLPELAHDAHVRERFVREGYAANTIEHPGALSVLDDDVSEDGLPFLVMELLEGETVEARWASCGNRMDLAEVLSITAALLDVLAAAHAKGVVHRDIKPENLFLLSAGGLKVLDFGIARVLESRGTETRAGTVMGTPAFMAPEQALAKWDSIDGRTDLWAVGATMFTLLSGHHVHEGQTGNEQLIKTATQPARSIGAVVQGLPRSVVALVDRSLKFEVAARWPDAHAMLEAVSGAYEVLTGQPLIIVPPPSPVASAVIPRQAGQGTNPGHGPQSSRISSSGTRMGAGPPAASAPAAPKRTTSGAFTQPTVPSAVAAFPVKRTESVQSAAVRISAAGFPGSSRRGSGSFDVAGPTRLDQAQGASPNLAPPSSDALGLDAYVASRTAERDLASAEALRLAPIAAEIQGRLAAVRRRVAQAQEQIAEVRKERANDEQRFRRQTDARLAGLGEARKGYRSAMGEVATLALADAANFPPDIGSAERATIATTRAVAEAREREAALHHAAYEAYDPDVLKRGIAIGVAGVVLFLVLFFSPMMLRGCGSDAGTGTLGSPPTSGETPSP